MKTYNSMEKRFKDNYESRSRVYLYRRMPVIIRLDGKAFHTFTGGFDKPFDGYMMRAMQETAKYLCENIQGCVLAYTQSDEISLLLIDYETLDSDAWFDYRLDKLVSVSASLATLQFNRVFAELVRDDKKYAKALAVGALFDARAFNLPKEEVTNYFYSRQADATRNSIQMVAQKYFSHAELMGKDTNMLQDMLLTQKDVNWNDFSIPEKRGTCCIRTENGWIIDEKMPILKESGRDYIEQLV